MAPSPENRGKIILGKKIRTNSSHCYPSPHLWQLGHNVGWWKPLEGCLEVPADSIMPCLPPTADEVQQNNRHGPANSKRLVLIQLKATDNLASLWHLPISFVSSIDFNAYEFQLLIMFLIPCIRLSLTLGIFCMLPLVFMHGMSHVSISPQITDWGNIFFPTASVIDLSSPNQDCSLEGYDNMLYCHKIHKDGHHILLFRRNTMGKSSKFQFNSTKPVMCTQIYPVREKGNEC